MNILPLLLIAGGVAYVVSSDKKSIKTTSSSHAPGTARPPSQSIFKDCEWIIEGKNKLSFESFISSQKSKYEKIILDNITSPDFGIMEIANTEMKLLLGKGCKTINPEGVSVLDTDSVKFIYVLSIISAAMYVSLYGSATDFAISTWLYSELPTLLISLGILKVGYHGQDDPNSILTTIKNTSVDKLVSVFKSVLSTTPILKTVNAELFATLYTIIFSLKFSIETKNNLVKIKNLYVSDYTALSGSIKQEYLDFYELLFNAIVIANPKK